MSTITNEGLGGIRIKRAYFLIGCLLVILPFTSQQYYYYTFNIDFESTVGWLMFASAWVMQFFLEAYIIISLLSHYKIVRNRITLIVAVGFIFLFSTNLLGAYQSIVGAMLAILTVEFSESVSYLLWIMLLQAYLTLVGHALFLVAVLRMKGA
jgi:hypothetical protein